MGTQKPSICDFLTLNKKQSPARMKNFSVKMERAFQWGTSVMDTHTVLMAQMKKTVVCLIFFFFLLTFI